MTVARDFNSKPPMVSDFWLREATRSIRSSYKSLTARVLYLYVSSFVTTPLPFGQRSSDYITIVRDTSLNSSDFYCRNLRDLSCSIS